MPLCENRHELSGSPSTCTLDTVLVPLPSFLLVIFLSFALLFLRFSSTNGALDQHRFFRESRGLRKYMHITYFVLIVATFAMRVLEIARLVAAKLGVGLLPIGLVAVLLLGWAVWGNGEGTGRGRRRGILLSAIILGYWVLLTIFEAVKVVRLQSLDSRHLPSFAKGTMYPSSDWLLDNAVMLGLYAVFSVYEGFNLLYAWKSSNVSQFTSHEKGALMTEA